MANWTHFCGEEFYITDQHTLGNCFQLLVINIPSCIFLSVCSAYFLGTSGPKYRRSCHHINLLNFRFAITISLFICCIFRTLYLNFKSNNGFSGINYIWAFSSSASWLLYARFSYVLCKNASHTTRGPSALLVCIVLTLAASILDLYGFIVHESTTSSQPYYFLLCIMMVTLQVCLLITLIPKALPLPFGYGEIRRINEAESEREPLLWQWRERNHFREPEPLGNAADTSNIISKIVFFWILPLLQKGSNGALNTCQDLYELPHATRTEVIMIKVNRGLRQIKSRLQNNRTLENVFEETEFKLPKRFLVMLFNKCYGCKYYSLGFLKLITDSLAFSGPILLNKIISFLENNTEPVSHGYWYASLLFVLMFLSTFLGVHYQYLVSMLSLKVRSAIIGLIYRKTLGISQTSSSKFSMGEIIDYVSTDADRIANFCQSFHQVWSLPFQIGVVLFLLHQQLGLSFLAGFTFAVLLVPLNWKIASKIASISIDWMDRKDKRLKLITEVLLGIRVIKMHAWEDIFSQKVKRSRKDEVRFLKKKKLLDTFCVFFWATTPILISVSTFAMYTLLGNNLTAAKVFTSLALFKMLITPLNAFPWVVNGVIEAWISLCRVEKFLTVEDLNFKKYYTFEKNDDTNVLEVVNGQFSWMCDIHASTSPQALPFTLGPINVDIKKGEFVGVTGQVGSGKSTLLAAILADINCNDGSILLEEKYLTCGLGYVSQEPWLQNITIQQNILFGKNYDQARYREVLEACALVDDLKQFSLGDQTEIGERGITLSGGQKARLSLARALYQDFDLYILDDPFSSVDIHVAQTIYKKCIRGILRNKTLLICTHHVKYLLEADRVIILADGIITHSGLPSEVLKMEFDQESILDATQDKKDEMKVQATSKNILMNEEEREFGNIGFHVYRSYWLAVGSVVATVCLVSFFLMQSSSIISDWWLAFWSSDIRSNCTNRNLYPHVSEALDWLNSGSTQGRGITFYLGVYCGIAGANSLFTLARAFSFQQGGIRSAVVLHHHLLKAVLTAPAVFFDTTPMGRILNRFSSDMNMVDDSLPFVLNMFLAHTFNVFGTVVVTCYGITWMIAFIVPLSIIYFYVQRYYRRTSRELKRLHSITLSPLYAHFSETVAGLTTIRAMGSTKRFCQENEAKLDNNQRAGFASLAASQWLSLVLQLIGVVVVTAVAFFAVFQKHTASVDPGLMGLTMSYALSLTLLLSKLIASFTETEKEMVSVERLHQYIGDIQSENMDYFIQAPASWPEMGAITFSDVVLRYNSSHPPALRGISFSTLPGEKLGIVGRTGSGKSSIFQALFRMVPLEAGEIHIDGINIQHLNVCKYRSCLAIIPQDPFLFTGSVRENLDPSDSYSDFELWQSLEQCHLVKCVSKIGGLDGTVGDKGQNFSVGQRQLFCLARALLSRAKIICMDEATASVDHETDQAIQETIRNVFLESTVLTIAHRIETIKENDQILVMDKGRIVDIGPTKKILAKLNFLKLDDVEDK